MSLATPECKTYWFPRFLSVFSQISQHTNQNETNTVRASTELTLIQGLAYTEQNSPPHQTAFARKCGHHSDRRARRAPQSMVEKKNDDEVEL